MYNYKNLYKEISRIESEVSRINKIETNHNRIKSNFKLDGVTIESFNDADIDKFFDSEEFAKSYNKLYDNINMVKNEVMAKIIDQLDIDPMDHSINCRIYKASYYQDDKSKTNTYVVTFKVDDKEYMYNAEMNINFNNGKMSLRVTPCKDKNCNEYGSADLGDMLPQTQVQEPVLNRDVETTSTSDVPKEEVRDINFNAKDLSEERSMNSEISKAIAEKSLELMDVDPIESFMLRPVLEAPIDMIYDMKEKSKQDKLMYLYYDREVLKRAIKLHDEFDRYMSKKYLEKLKKQYIAKDNAFNKVNSKIKFGPRGKADFKMRQVDGILDRKFNEAHRIIKQKIDEITQKYSDEKLVFRSIDKIFADYIHKVKGDRVNLKKYLSNLQKVTESMMNQYPEDHEMRHIFESCISGINGIILENESMSVMESEVMDIPYINITESFNQDYNAIRTSMMVILESLKESMDEIKDYSVMDIMEKVYDTIITTTAKIDIYKKDEDVLLEKSHGKLKYDYRKGYDYDTGHAIKVVYGLDNIKVDSLGDGYAKVSGRTSSKEREEDKNDVQKNITKKGNADHLSSGQKVLAIIDRVTNKKLQKVRMIGPFAPSMWSETIEPDEKTVKRLHSYYNSKGKDFIDKYVHEIKVGDIDGGKSFKSTKWFKNDKVTEDIDGYSYTRDNTVERGNAAESLKYARGEKLNKIKGKWTVGDKVEYESTITEAADIEEEMKPIVDILNSKGFKVKYANPGHLNFRSKHDGKRDGVMYNKIYSDAHIQFDGNYGIKAPEYWSFRTTKDGDYLDVKEPTNEINTNNREEINNFRGNYKKKYMASLKSWAESLPEFDGDVNSTKNDPLLKKESFEFDDIFN